MLTIQIPRYIRSNQEGFLELARICQEAAVRECEEIALDFQNNLWFDANMLAILGAIVDSFRSHSFQIVHLKGEQEKIFRKTCFLRYFGGDSVPDRYHTTVEYRKSNVEEISSFAGYLDEKLLSHKAFPKLSALLKKEIQKSILEIFNNACMHGGCEFVFSCGQSYPRDGRLDFTIVDMGRTIRKNVRDYLQEEVSGKEAIDWAVRENTTTKRENIPGGLGFTLIREFLYRNHGTMQIVSAEGYWCQARGCLQSEDLGVFFGGTAVNLEFNVQDTSCYCLGSETEDVDISF